MERLHERRKKEITWRQGVAAAKPINGRSVNLAADTQQRSGNHGLRAGAVGIDRGLCLAEELAEPFLGFFTLGATQQRSLIVGPFERGILLCVNLTACICPSECVEKDHGGDSVEHNVMEIHEKPCVFAVAHHHKAIERFAEKVERTHEPLHVLPCG